MSARPLSRVEDLDAQIASLREARDRALVEVQETCDHPVEAMRRGEYKPEGIITYTRPDFLLCMNCGLAEEGWGYFAAFEKHYEAHYAFPELERDVAMRLVRTFRNREQVNAARDAARTKTVEQCLL